MKTFWSRFWRETEGQDLVEYALIIAVIALGMVAAVKGVTSALLSVYSTITEGLSNFATG